jgi:hypothetical protein
MATTGADTGADTGIGAYGGGGGGGGGGGVYGGKRSRSGSFSLEVDRGDASSKWGRDLDDDENGDIVERVVADTLRHLPHALLLEPLTSTGELKRFLRQRVTERLDIAIDAATSRERRRLRAALRAMQSSMQVCE